MDARPSTRNNVRSPKAADVPAGGLAIWMLTHVCTQKCGYCAIAGSKGGGRPDRDRAMEIAGELAEGGFREVIIAGGEPLLVPFLADVLEELSRGVRTAVFSGGAPLDPGILLARLGAGPGRMVISLDAATKALNDSIRGRANATRDTWALVEAIRAKWPRMDMSFNTVVSNRNVDALGSVWPCIRRHSPTGWSLTLAGDNMGFTPRDWFLDPDRARRFYRETVPFLAGRLSGTGVRLDVLPVPGPFLENGVPMDRWKAEWAGFEAELELEMERYAAGLYNESFADRHGCPLALGDVTIGPSGDVYPCSQAPIMQAEYLLGRLGRDGGLSEIVGGEQGAKFICGIPHDPCRTCWAPSNVDTPKLKGLLGG